MSKPIKAHKYKVGDKVLLLDSAHEQLPGAASQKEAQDRVGPLAITDAFEVPVDDVVGYQSLSFKEIPYNVGNIDVKPYQTPIFNIGDRVWLTEEGFKSLPPIDYKIASKCPVLTIRHIGKNKDGSVNVFFNEINSVLGPEDIMMKMPKPKEQIMRRKQLLNLITSGS